MRLIKPKAHLTEIFIIAGLFLYDSACSKKMPVMTENGHDEVDVSPDDEKIPEKDPVPPPVFGMTLWCRYRTEYGRLYETSGLDKHGQVIMFAQENNGQKYFWECPDPYYPALENEVCPRYTESNITNYSDLYLMMNNANEVFNPGNPQIPQFAKEALESCQNDTPHEGSTFVEYGIRSMSDLQPYLFHKPFFGAVPNDIPKTSLPFSRIVVFGDSISDNGYFWDEAGHTILQWPYFMGRFSNGLVWVDQLVEKLNQIQKFTPNVDLYNYAVGGSGSATVGYNYGFSNLDRQVTRYLNDMSEAEKTTPDWNSGYNKTLYVVFIGTNDYFVMADSTLKDLAGYCGPQVNTESVSPADLCAKTVVYGNSIPTYNSIGIKNDIKKIIEQANKKNPGEEMYFLVPLEPDMSSLPYYNLFKFPPPTKELVASALFVNMASLSHNIYLSKAIEEIKAEFPQNKLHFLTLNMYQIFNGLMNDTSGMYYEAVKLSGIKNKTDACFTGGAMDMTPSLKFCLDPASNMFWDPVHPSMTTHCDIAEVALRELYTNFVEKGDYTPDFGSCHKSFVKHPLSPYIPL